MKKAKDVRLLFLLMRKKTKNVNQKKSIVGGDPGRVVAQEVTQEGKEVVATDAEGAHLAQLEGEGSTVMKKRSIVSAEKYRAHDQIVVGG